MPAEIQPSLSDDLMAFTARLDDLRADQNPDDLSNALRTAFKERELYNAYITSLVGDTKRVKALLEVFDKALQTTTHDVTIFKQFRQLCGRKGLLPTSHIIPEEYVRTTEYPVAYGGFSDVWEGIYKYKRVAIKAFRVYKGCDVRQVRKLFCKEVAMWKRISHPNIVPLLGVSEAPAPLCMVSEWMPNGHVRNYVEKNPGASRLQLFLDVGCGLLFLHSLDIVHGDLKGDNVLVDKSGCARLNDFGFTSIASLHCTETSASRFKGSHRWMAPELFNLDEGKSGLCTRNSDIFALGMVAVELFTGQVPFSENNASPIVIKRIIDGERPLRPLRGKEFGLSNELWELVRSSWVHEEEERPSVSAFVDFLKQATPDIAVLKELTEFDATSEEDIQKLCHILGYEDNTLLGMREENTLILIEVLDQVLNSSSEDSTLRSWCLYGLQKISSRCGLLPRSYWISHSGPAEPADAPSAAVRAPSTCRRLTNGRLVAVMTISPDCTKDFTTVKRRLCTNGIIWKRLHHPNVVGFLGFSPGAYPFSLVYHWMSNGSLCDYVRENPAVDKLDLLLDVARGLAYLHKYDLVHGSLTGHNTLVDNNGVACISEYGLEAVLRDEASSESIPTNVRWMAPEILSASGRRAPPGSGGKAADVYSFAMVMFEALTSTTPFPDGSDEVVRMVVAGFRPERPFGDPSQELADELWEQIVACWNKEPNERPTAFEVLRALGEAKPREDADDSDQATVVRECDSVTDDDPVSPTYEEFRKHYNPDNQSSGTLVSSPILGHPTSPLSESDTLRSGGSGRRLSMKVGEYMRSFFHLPKHSSVTITTGAIRRREMIEKPTLGIEMIDQREGMIVVRDASVPYVVSRPIPEGKALRKVVITVISKDQGWSSYLEDYGTYRNSWTWFELSVGPSTKGSREKWRGVVVRNLLAHHNFKEHTIEISDRELYEKAESGDVLTVWALAKFSGSMNMVKKVKVRYVVE